MMRTSDVITDIIREMKPTSAPVMETSDLYADLGFDSLAFVRLLLRIEEAFMISFGLAETGQCLRVDRLIALAELKAKEVSHD